MVKYELPRLPYSYTDLEPHIDSMTMQIHHQKHHQAYTDGLNKTLEEISSHSHPKYVSAILQDLQSIPETIRAQMNFFGGGYENHRLFWEIMNPDGGGTPGGKIGDAIEVYFDGFEKFKDFFSKQTAAIQGSGWGWLVYDETYSRIEFMTTENQTSPWVFNKMPLFGIDVWEHAYYLKYQNRRPEYIDAWWNIINWDVIEKRFSETTG